ncbi:MAG: hypothetical protein EA398_10170 [Deltaproteobacteria bacterium]|nr:MAG: hypothetical protein EA398_10170 [Deltaproteobacteria bacterium]
MRRTLYWSCVVPFLFWMPVAFAEQVQPVFGWGEGEPVRVALEDLNPQPRSSPWFQSWDHMIWTDDNRVLFIQYTISSVGFGLDGKGSARILVIDRNVADPNTVEDAILRFDRGYDQDRGDYTWEEEGFTLAFQGSIMRRNADGTMRLEVRLPTVRVDADIDPVVDLWAPGAGRMQLGWDRRNTYRLRTVPHFRARGTWGTRPDRDGEWSDRPFTGVGHFQATWSNAFPYDIGQQFTRFHALREDGLTLSFGDVVAPTGNGGGSTAWLLAAVDGQPVFEAADVQVVYRGRSEQRLSGATYAVPSGFTISASNGRDRVEIDVTFTRMVAWDALLSRLSRMIRAILSRIMAPVDIEHEVDYRARLIIDGHEVTVSGRGWASVSFVQGR